MSTVFPSLLCFNCLRGLYSPFFGRYVLRGSGFEHNSRPRSIVFRPPDSWIYRGWSLSFSYFRVLLRSLIWADQCPIAPVLGCGRKAEDRSFEFEWEGFDRIMETNRIASRKHLLTTSNSNVGQQTQQRGSAEAQPPLRSSSSSAANHPIPITSAAELQRPSSGSPISSSDVDTSMMANGSAGGGTGSDGHMPHMLCEYSNSLFPLFGLN